MPERVALAWSSGKDSAWTLHRLQQDPQYEVVVLLTTLDTAGNCVTSHGVAAQLLARQATAVGLPLHRVSLPWPRPNQVYEDAMAAACAQLIDDFQVTHLAFGDLLLEDVRAYRERILQGSRLRPLFPLWGSHTAALAREMVDGGLQARLSSVDLGRLPAHLAGCRFDHDLLDALPAHIDPCGENGEFHTFVSAAPPFKDELNVTVSAVLARNGFAYAQLNAADNDPSDITDTD